MNPIISFTTRHSSIPFTTARNVQSFLKTRYPRIPIEVKDTRAENGKVTVVAKCNELTVDVMKAEAESWWLGWQAHTQYVTLSKD